MNFSIIKSMFDPKYKYVFLFSRVETEGGIYIINSAHKTEDEVGKTTPVYASIYQEAHNQQCDDQMMKILAEEALERFNSKLVPVEDITAEAIKTIESTRQN